MAICQGIILNTNATQSSTANVARAIMIVLIMVKYSVLQMNPGQNSPCILLIFLLDRLQVGLSALLFEVPVISWSPFLHEFFIFFCQRGPSSWTGVFACCSVPEDCLSPATCGEWFWNLFKILKGCSEQLRNCSFSFQVSILGKTAFQVTLGRMSMPTARC